MKTAPEVVTRLVGECQICANVQKLDDRGTLVHHGYQRPGWGHIHGDCMGVHSRPYEQSCDRLKQYIGTLGDWAEDASKYLATLKRGEVTRIERRARDWGKPGFGRRGEYKQVVYTPASAEWGAVLRGAIYAVERKLEHLLEDAAQCEARVAAWTLKPVRTVEECKAEERAGVEARKAVKQATRDAKAAKKADLAAKREKLVAERAAKRAELIVAFERLAAQPQSAERDAEARKLFASVCAKRNAWLFDDYRAVRKLDAPLVALGLATWHSGSEGRHARWHV